jgi:hypothetical protein
LRSITIDAKQILQARGFRRIAPLRKRQLPRDQVQHVDGDTQLERVVAADDRRDVVAEEIRDRLGQLDWGRFVLHPNLSLFWA